MSDTALAPLIPAEELEAQIRFFHLFLFFFCFNKASNLSTCPSDLAL